MFWVMGGQINHEGVSYSSVSICALDDCNGLPDDIFNVKSVNEFKANLDHTFPT